MKLKKKIKKWFTKTKVTGKEETPADYANPTIPNSLDWEHVGYASGATLAIIGLVWFISYKCKHKK